MSNIRRYYQENNIYFVTSVTYKKNPILIENAQVLSSSIEYYKQEYNLDIIAFVILPDHFHIIINPKHHNLSGIMRKIKLKFSGKYRHSRSIEKGRIWQNRFWDHIIRDENDLNKHIDYIHYNPVKHNYIQNPFSWENSSIHKFREKNIYADDWGTNFDYSKLNGDFGE